MPHAILFDLDGTLVDSNDLHVSAWDDILREAGHVIDRARLHAQIGQGTDNYLPALLPQIGPSEIARLGEARGGRFKAGYLRRVRPFAGARDLLARCKAAGHKVVLATSASASELDYYLELLDARGLVNATTSADEVAHTKPCPDIFDMARRKAGVEANHALVVDDTPFDVLAARAAGMPAVAVRSGGFDDAVLAGAIAIYADVAAILARFDRSPLA